MSEKWDFYDVTVGGRPAYIFCDLELVSKAPIAALSISAHVRLTMNKPREDGLSSEEEFDTLIQIEEALECAFSETTHTIYVGRVTWGGVRDFHFYTDDKDKFKKNVAGSMSTFSSHKFVIKAHPDPEWNVYLNLLYPSPNNLQIIKNRRVCDRLEKLGDSLVEKRPIDHWVYFSDEVSAKSYKKHVQDVGFALREFRTPDTSCKDYTIQFWRHDSPSDINTVILPLFERAVELGGTYDGWECQVLN